LRRVVQRVSDGAEGGGDVLHDQGGGQTNHAHTPAVAPLVAHGVMRMYLGVVVDAAIDLYGQVAVHAVEVRDERPNGPLPAELKTTKSSAA